MERIKPFVDAMMAVGNLDENQAKTLVYGCIMTWSDKPKIRPLVNINGESGTGKNGILRQIEHWCRRPKWINARNKTDAQLRDDLESTVTAFVEEADKTKEPKKCENWYQNRYDESGKKVTYKKVVVTDKGQVMSKDGTHNHFGYTFLHTQQPFVQTEMERRTLRITLFKESKRVYKATEGLVADTLKDIAKEIDWEQEIPQEYSNSAWDVWKPFIRVALSLNDNDFLEYTIEQIRLKTEEDDDTKEFEPKGVVLGEIVEMYLKALDEGRSGVAITELRKQVTERDYQLNEKQVTGLTRQLGFPIVKPHNKSHVKVESLPHMCHIVEKAGYDIAEILGDVEQVARDAVLAVN